MKIKLSEDIFVEIHEHCEKEIEHDKHIRCSQIKCESESSIICEHCIFKENGLIIHINDLCIIK